MAKKEKKSDVLFFCTPAKQHSTFNTIIAIANHPWMINYPDPRSPLQIVLLFRFINSIIRIFFSQYIFFLFFAVQYNNYIYIFIPPTYILLKFRTLRVETPARNQWAHTLLTQQTTLGFVYERRQSRISVMGLHLTLFLILPTWFQSL